jgi:aerobic-type carbon monoxide dehydrogenase small subunit (CoxS/CutS family)
MDANLKITVNGTEQRITSDPERSLLDVLREDLGLTGPKYACGEGHCGACTVLVDGRSIRSCVTSVGAVADRSIMTIEGLTRTGTLHPVQEAFMEEGAVQCGYCTGGMILSAVALLDKNADPTDEKIIQAMDGHICRCNGYPKIVNAVRRASKRMRGVRS